VIETESQDIDPREVAERLRSVLAALERGELTAPGPMVAHLRGALAALELIAANKKADAPVSPS
jgi:hypothetical protein